MEYETPSQLVPNSKQPHFFKRQFHLSDKSPTILKH